MGKTSYEILGTEENRHSTLLNKPACVDDHYASVKQIYRYYHKLVE